MPQTVAQALKEFAKQPGCEAYTADSERIKLLTTYLWLRQLTEGLSFEVFLEKFAPLADFNEENRKHPADALHYFCPRSKKQAESQGMPQWSAEECVDLLGLYVDMVREAEATNVPVPLSAADFFKALGPEYKAGNLKPPEEPKQPRAPKASGGKKKSSDEQPVAVALAEGQRVIYSMAGGGRQMRGVVTRLFEEGDPPRQYAGFRSDAGEDFDGVNRAHLAPISEEENPRPSFPPNAVRERQKLWIPKAQGPQVQAALALTAPMGNVNLGDAIYPFMQGYSDGKAASVVVMNGERGPYVDAQLIAENGDVIADCAPRKNILGEYSFQTDEGIYVLEVVQRE